MQPATIPIDPNEVTPKERAAAEAEIRRMRKALAGWLRYRSINDQHGSVAARDWALESRLASQLYVLLSEMFDPAVLPKPGTPNAAVKLAQIAVAGRLPTDVVTPSAVGFIWLWPAVIVVGLVLFTIVYKIRSDAEVAEEKEKLECIKVGACTDYGFWLKIGAVAVLGYFAWTKLGGRELAARAQSRVAG